VPKIVRHLRIAQFFLFLGMLFNENIRKKKINVVDEIRNAKADFFALFKSLSKD
jgi:hypothetical protein